MKYLIILVFISTTYSLTAQNPGYLGKKNVIEVFTTPSIPLLDIVFGGLSNGNNSYVSDGDNLKVGKDFVDFGYHINFSRALSRNFGVALEIGMDYSSFVPDRPDIFYLQEGTLWEQDYVATEYLDANHERFQLRSNLIMPKIEYSKQGGILPIGIIHQFGFGFGNLQIVDKKYIQEINETITSSKIPSYDIIKI